MEALYPIFLTLHIGAGFISLFSGTWIAATTKGTQTHKKLGKVFSTGMAVVSLTALLMTWIHPNGFLLAVGLFTAYLLASGYWALHKTGSGPKIYHWTLPVAGVLVGGWMISHQTLILMVFGIICSLSAIGDARLLYTWHRKGNAIRKRMLNHHLSMMLGAFIASVTAFLVVNVQLSPAWLVWLLPTVILSPLGFKWGRKYKLIALLIFLGPLVSNAQESKQRHQFATMYGGLTQGISAHSSTTSILIGATHFWGHADFQLAIPIVFQDPIVPGVSTTFRYLPWAIKSKTIRPFIGFTWNPIGLELEANNQLQKQQISTETGFLAQWSAHQVDFCLRYVPTYQVEYQGNLGGQVKNLGGFEGMISYRYSIDVTQSAAPSWENGKAQALTEKLGKAGRLNGFTLSAGISSSFFLRPQSLSSEAFNQPKWSHVFPEFGIGYYWQQPDVQFSFNFRTTTFTNEGASALTLERTALVAECFKFFGDYHGFAWFLGAHGGLNALEANWKEFSVSSNQWAAGFVAGWDIRPNELQGWYLRTALRWFTPMTINKAGNTYAWDQLEVNFIQLVILPERWF